MGSFEIGLKVAQFVWGLGCLAAIVWLIYEYFADLGNTWNYDGSADNFLINSKTHALGWFIVLCILGVNALILVLTSQYSDKLVLYLVPAIVLSSIYTLNNAIIYFALNFNTAFWLNNLMRGILNIILFGIIAFASWGCSKVFSNSMF